VLIALVAVTLWHELGHLLAARLVKAPVSRIYIGWGPVVWHTQPDEHFRLVLRALPLGMSVAVPSRRDLSGHVQRAPGADLWIAAGGPLASVLLTAAIFAAVRGLDLPYALAHGWVGVGLLSLGLALLNLLPVPGLDGGHLVLLTAACFGCELSPQREARLHRIGVRVAILAGLVVPPGIWWANRIPG
jgi:membrane-associated protease RseP (regulator of RpoE activity)